MPRPLIRCILSCALLFVGVACKPQSTFNVVQHHPSTLSYNGAVSVNEQSDGYLVFSIGWALDSSSSAVHIVKFDLEGNFQWLKEHRREYDVSIGYIDPVSEITGGRYVASLMEFGNASQIPRSNYLYWFDAEGDTIRTRFFRSDSATEGNIGSRQLVALSDGGFLNCGWCGDPINTGCITRLDSTGSILWEKLYTNTNTINNAIQLEDGGFVLGGTRNGNLDKAVVIRTDSLGVVQWSRYNGLYASTTTGHRCLVGQNGTIRMPGSWNPDPAWSANDSWACLFEYNDGGSLVGRKDYAYSRYATSVHILDKGDGHTWLVGGMYQYGVDPDAVMLLSELDENLDSLWMRRYWYYSVDDAENAMYSVRKTSDGGLVMCGVTRQGITDPLPYMQSNWLLKLDEHGCLVPGCHTVGIEEVVLGLSDALKISPNPVAQGGTLRVRFEAPEGFATKGPLRIVVLDALGRQVHAELLSGVAGQLSTSSWPSGLYYLHIADGARWIAGAKVVVSAP